MVADAKRVAGLGWPLLDLVRCLHVLADQCTVWVWPERRSAWVRWQALRRAVFSQQPKPESVL